MSNSNTMDTAADRQISEAAPELQRGPDWLRKLRNVSREQFNTLPLPRRGLALWRYTDPQKFLINQDAVVDRPLTEESDEAIRLVKQQLDSGSLAALVTDFGGREITVYEGASIAQANIVIAPLSTAVEKHADLIEKHLYSQVNNGLGKFEALNGALWNDGIFIYVPDGKTVPQPIHLLREAGREGTACFPRLLVVVGRNAEMTLVDEYAGGSTDIEQGITNVNSAVEIIAAEDSRVRYVSVQRQGFGTNSYLTHRAKIGQGASMLTVPLAFGGNVTKQNFGVELSGRGADSNMYGMLFGSGHQHFDNHTLHEHSSGNTTSDIDFKVVLRDKAISAYTGLIKIERHAKTCEAYQENRNLVLNRGPKAETIPELEILNEDVKCSHGATIGPIDPESIFYLKSRGIAYDDAVRMIVSGFVQSTLAQIPDDLRERIGEFVTQRLEGI